MVGIFSIAMAYLESAVVVYLRQIYGIKDLLTDLPTRPDRFTLIETGREICTLAMLAAIGWLAGHRWQGKIGYALIAFGVWDIFYYVWLRIFIGWPTSLTDWDILFLLPLPWWGPVYSPIVIASLMIIWGVIFVVRANNNIIVRFPVYYWTLLCFSLLLALFVFMKDAVYALPGGAEALWHVRPTVFDWPFFLLSMAGIVFLTFKIARDKPKSRL